MYFNGSFAKTCGMPGCIREAQRGQSGVSRLIPPVVEAVADFGPHEIVPPLADGARFSMGRPDGQRSSMTGCSAALAVKVATATTDVRHYGKRSAE
jgi:hypothetical protein